ncbi:hypothetical protein SCUCBS95973_007358 [Sporothrix curviconia]|uniref:Uncharacterized protein n=1 Tax=Sporothrix curviconia TaxID=1260050 RepID=A0ABP0CD23_9PEZI
MASSATQATPPPAKATKDTPKTSQKKTKTKTITRKRTIAGRGQPAAAATKPLGVLFVATKAPFLSVVNRAVKLLDKGPGGARWSSTKVVPLEERVSSVTKTMAMTAATTTTASDAKTARSRSVLLLGTGHATTKLVQIAAWFQRQPGYVVAVRTRSSATVDDVFTVETIGEGDDDDGEDDDEDAMEVDSTTKKTTEPRRSTRRRNVNCLEVAVRLK